VIVVILGIAVLGLFVISLTSSLFGNRRQRSWFFARLVRRTALGPQIPTQQRPDGPARVRRFLPPTGPAESQQFSQSWLRGVGLDRIQRTETRSRQRPRSWHNDGDEARA